MTNSDKLKHCAGCHDDVYNHGCGGAKQCWQLESMKLIKRKEVHISQVPPWNQKAQLFPNCYHKPKYVYVGADQTY